MRRKILALFHLTLSFTAIASHETEQGRSAPGRDKVGDLKWAQILRVDTGAPLVGTQAQALQLCNRSGWRLPNILELRKLNQEQRLASENGVLCYWSASRGAGDKYQVFPTGVEGFSPFSFLKDQTFVPESSAKCGAVCVLAEEPSSEAARMCPSPGPSGDASLTLARCLLKEMGRKSWPVSASCGSRTVSLVAIPAADRPQGSEPSLAKQTTRFCLLDPSSVVAGQNPELGCFPAKGANPDPNEIPQPLKKKACATEPLENVSVGSPLGFEKTDIADGKHLGWQYQNGTGPAPMDYAEAVNRCAREGGRLPSFEEAGEMIQRNPLDFALLKQLKEMNTCVWTSTRSALPEFPVQAYEPAHPNPNVGYKTDVQCQYLCFVPKDALAEAFRRCPVGESPPGSLFSADSLVTFTVCLKEKIGKESWQLRGFCNDGKAFARSVLQVAPSRFCSVDPAQATYGAVPTSVCWDQTSRVRPDYGSLPDELRTQLCSNSGVKRLDIPLSITEDESLKAAQAKARASLPAATEQVEAWFRNNPHAHYGRPYQPPSISRPGYGGGGDRLKVVAEISLQRPLFTGLVDTVLAAQMGISTRPGAEGEPQRPRQIKDLGSAERAQLNSRWGAKAAAAAKGVKALEEAFLGLNEVKLHFATYGGEGYWWITYQDWIQDPSDGQMKQVSLMVPDSSEGRVVSGQGILRRWVGVEPPP